MEKDERASFEDLHVSYPDESVTEDIYQFSYDKIIECLPKNKTVLDIGCGIGKLANRIADFSKETIGIDIAEDRIETAKQIHNKKNLKFFVSDAYDLPLKGDSVDVIVSLGVFHHLELEKIAPEIDRILKKNGIMLVLDIYEGFQRPSARIKSWIKMFQRDGFSKTLKVFFRMLPLFLREKNREHRKNDRERMIKMNKYTFAGFNSEYSKVFKNCKCNEDIFPYATCYYVKEN